MEKKYKVDFVPSVSKAGTSVLTSYEKPMEGLDLANDLEALLIERDQIGFKLFQVVEYQRSNPLTGKDLSGLLVVFEKK